MITVSVIAGVLAIGTTVLSMCQHRVESGAPLLAVAFAFQAACILAAWNA